jgi:hypothetical protein
MKCAAGAEDEDEGAGDAAAGPEAASCATAADDAPRISTADTAGATIAGRQTNDRFMRSKTPRYSAHTDAVGTDDRRTAYG